MNTPAYSEEITALARAARMIGPLAQPGCTQEARSRVCGARISVDLILRDGHVIAYGHRLQACQIGCASAAILGRWIMGRDHQALMRAIAALEAMLQDPAASLADEHSALAPLRAIASLRSRHPAARLPWVAACAALDSQATNGPLIILR